MRFFDHFGHFAHGHGGAFVAIAVAVVVAIVIAFTAAIRSNQKNTNA
jgi:hypothetical protein